MHTHKNTVYFSFAIISSMHIAILQTVSIKYLWINKLYKQCVYMVKKKNHILGEYEEKQKRPPFFPFLTLYCS